MEVKDKLTTLESLKVAYDANRESINTLSEELLAQMGDVAQQSDVDALNARVTNLELNAGGDSNAEVVDARVSNSGTTYGTLKERLDEEYNQLTKELEEDINQLSEKKVNIPDDGYGTPLYGTSGQVLQTKGDGTTQWVNASGGSGLTEDLKSELKNFFANMQVLVRQIAYVTEENIGATLISNAHGVVNALDGTATEEPEVPEGVALVSISATYAGGEVNAGTDLTDLDGITVTATYSDGSNANVTKYTLIGEIAVGSNTITVIYGGLTTAFEVVGIKEILYQLSSQTTFDGTNNIDTGVSLLSTDSDWTVVADLESEETGEEEWVFHAINLKSPWEQFGLAQKSNKIWRVNYGVTQQHQMVNLGTSCPNIKIVITHTTGNNYVDIKAIDKDGNYSGVYSGQCIYNSSVVFNGNIVIGSHMENKNYWKGVANDFKIYSRVLSDDEISTYLV